MELFMFMQKAKDTGGSDTSYKLDENLKWSWSKTEEAEQLNI